MSARFDADGDILVASGGPNVASCTFAAWVQLVSDRNSAGWVIWFTDTIDAVGLLVDSTGTALYLFTTAGGGIGPPLDLSDGVYRHVAFTVSGGVARFYVDGVLWASGATSYSFNPTNMVIGGDGGLVWSDSRIGKARVWSAPLTAEELFQERQSLTAQRTTNLYADWPLTADALDVSGNGRHLGGSASLSTDPPLGAGPYFAQGNAFEFGQYLGAAGPTPIDGVLSQNIGDVTVSATGTVEVRGVATPTVGAVTSTATGRVEIQGVATPTVGAVTSTATGTVEVRGVATPTVGAVTSSATGTVEIRGVATPTVGAITSTATGTVEIKGVATPTVGAVTSTATGTVEIKGVLSQTIGDVTLVATGGAGTSGVLSQNIGDITLSSTGKVDVQGVLSKTIGDVTVSSTGTVRIAGVAAIQIGDFTSTATGTVLVQGVLNKTIGDITLLATGSTIAVREGSLSASIGEITLVATARQRTTILGIGATIQAGSNGGGLIKRPYSKTRFRQEQFSRSWSKWPSR